LATVRPNPSIERAAKARFGRLGPPIMSNVGPLLDEAAPFCPQCGATVNYELDGNPEHVAVPVGAFAEPGFPAPSFSVYKDRMHSWVQLPAGIDHIA
jgi:hypothetical protein